MDRTRLAVRRYVCDYFDKDLLNVMIIRSKVSRGKILSIQIPPLPKDIVVIDTNDIRGTKTISINGEPVPLLTNYQVDYLGQPILLVAGPDKNKLSLFAEKILIETIEEKPVLSWQQMAENKPRYSRILRRGRFLEEESHQEPDLIQIEQTLETGFQEHYYADSLGCLCEIENENYIFHMSTQWPYLTISSVAAVLDVPVSCVNLKQSSATPSLDGKLWYPTILAAYAALVSQKTGKDCKLILPKEEDFAFTPKRTPVMAKIRLACTKEGELKEIEASLTADCGANAVFGQELADRLVFGLQSLYPCQHVSLSALVQVSSRPPAGPFTGIGISQALFFLETTINNLATRTGRSIREWKKQHLLTRSHDEGWKNFRQLAEIIDAVCTQADFDRKHSSYELFRLKTSPSDKFRRGIGMSAGFQGAGMINSSDQSQKIALQMKKDSSGKVSVSVSTLPESPGMVRIWKMQISEILGVLPDDITVSIADPHRIKDSGPSILSRNSTLLTFLLTKGATTLKEKEEAGEETEVKPSMKMTNHSNWDINTFTGMPFYNTSTASCVVELEYLPVFHQLKIRGIWIHVDCGLIFDENLARNRIERETLAALGWCWHEQYYKESADLKQKLMDYSLLNTEEIPPIAVRFHKSKAHHLTPGGIEEIAFNLVPAAFASAISQAADHFIPGIPLNFESLSEFYP